MEKHDGFILPKMTVSGPILQGGHTLARVDWIQEEPFLTCGQSYRFDGFRCGDAVPRADVVIQDLKVAYDDPGIQPQSTSSVPCPCQMGFSILL